MTYKIFQSFQIESFCVLKMINQAAWGGNDDVRLLGQCEGLRYHVHTTNYYRTFDSYAGA